MGLIATWRHVKRLGVVEEGLRELQAQMKALDREWSDTHNDLQRMLGKISKRAKAVEREAEAAQHSATGADADSASGDANSGAMPTPIGSKMSTIMAQIKARRGG